MRARFLLIPLAVLALLVTGCASADPEPAPSPSPSATSPSDDPTTPEPTESATSAEGPKAFIRRWNDVKNEMLATGSVGGFRALAAKTCFFCSDLTTRVKDVYDPGGSLDTEGWTIRAIERAGGAPTRPEFTVEVDADAAVVRDAEGKVVQRFPGGEATYEIRLVKIASGWHMGEIAGTD